MNIISHRGNIIGKDLQRENNPKFIEETIEFYNLDCEIDLWSDVDRENYYLGHDHPQYKVTCEWLIKYNRSLLIHCKNSQAIDSLLAYHNFHYFYHENEKYAITSKMLKISSNPFVFGIYLNPELFGNKFTMLEERLSSNKLGIITDYPILYKER